MRLFGDATYFAIFLGGATFLPSFWWCDILSSLILYGDFCHLFEATTFLPFSGISYSEERIWARVCENSELKVEPG